jgi:hypothetical protein
MHHLTLKYERNDLRSVSGSARVMMGGHDVSQECGTIFELERVIDELHADLETIRKQGRLKFSATRKAQTDEWSHANRP